MNVLISGDSFVLNPMLVLMRSIIENNRKIVFYVIKTVLSDADVGRIRMLLEEYKSNAEVRFIDIDEMDVRLVKRIHYQFFQNAMSYGTWLKLLCLPQLPVDKILYLDTDIVVDGDLEELYGMAFGDNLIIGVPDAPTQDLSFTKFRLSMSWEDTYMNAGVMLLNVQELRKTVSPQFLIECMEKNCERIYRDHDQGLINRLWHGKIKFAPDKYNALSSESGKAIAARSQEQAVIYHWAGKTKPWSDYIQPEEGYVWDMEIYQKYSDIKGLELFHKKIIENTKQYRQGLNERLSAVRKKEVRNGDYGELLEYYIREVKNKKILLSNVLIEKGCRRIVIYGVGRAGKFLFDELILENCGIEIICFLDRFPAIGDYKGIPVMEPEKCDMTKEADAIIVSPMNIGFEVIKDYLDALRLDVRILSIVQIIYG